MEINFLMHFFNPLAKNKAHRDKQSWWGQKVRSRGKCNKFNLIYRIGLTLPSSRNNNSICK